MSKAYGPDWEQRIQLKEILGSGCIGQGTYVCIYVCMYVEQLCRTYLCNLAYLAVPLLVDDDILSPCSNQQRTLFNNVLLTVLCVHPPPHTVCHCHCVVYKGTAIDGDGIRRDVAVKGK